MNTIYLTHIIGSPCTGKSTLYEQLIHQNPKSIGVPEIARLYAENHLLEDSIHCQKIVLCSQLKLLNYANELALQKGINRIIQDGSIILNYFYTIQHLKLEGRVDAINKLKDLLSVYNNEFIYQNTVHIKKHSFDGRIHDSQACTDLNQKIHNFTQYLNLYNHLNLLA